MSPRWPSNELRRLAAAALLLVAAVGALEAGADYAREKVEEIASILPGMKSPTVLPLAEAGWVSIHSVIGERDFWEVVDNLKKAGAEGILVLSIDQMIR